MEAKSLLPKEVEFKLNDGDERIFCFLSLDVVGHSSFSLKFNQENIDNTLTNLRKWLTGIITNKNGKELNWPGDGGIFYFLQANVTDKAVESAVSSSINILEGLTDFNNSQNELYLEGNRTDIRLRLGMDFGRAIYRTDSGDWHSEALNTACKIQGLAAPNSALITKNVHKEINDSLRIRFNETSSKYNDRTLYIFSYERVIDDVYMNYFNSISRLR